MEKLTSLSHAELVPNSRGKVPCKNLNQLSFAELGIHPGHTQVMTMQAVLWPLSEKEGVHRELVIGDVQGQQAWYCYWPVRPKGACTQGFIPVRLRHSASGCKTARLK